MTRARTSSLTRRNPAATDGSATRADAVFILLEEYRALYALAQFRMGSLERRAPIAGAMLSAFLGSVTILPIEASLMFLLGLPMALLWFVRTTVIHAKSFADILRRIEAIELQVNAKTGEDLLVFQSTHPSRTIAVGGRIGREVTRSVAIGCLMLLTGCAYLFSVQQNALAEWSEPAYLCYTVATGLWMIREIVALTRYRPKDNTPPCGPLATEPQQGSALGSWRS